MLNDRLQGRRRSGDLRRVRRCGGAAAGADRRQVRLRRSAGAGPARRGLLGPRRPGRVPDPQRLSWKWSAHRSTTRSRTRGPRRSSAASCTRSTGRGEPLMSRLGSKSRSPPTATSPVPTRVRRTRSGRWRAAARVGVRARRLARAARPRGRRGQRQHADRRAKRWRTSAPRHGARHVRRRPGPWGEEPGRLVGRGPALPRARLRPHPPRARAAADGGRDDLPLRHRRDRVGARAGVGGRRRQGRHARRRRRARSSTSPPACRRLQLHVCRCCSAAASGCSRTSAPTCGWSRRGLCTPRK